MRFNGVQQWRRQTMTATNHDDQRGEIYPTMLNGLNCTFVVSSSRFHCCGRHGHGLWPLWFMAIIVEPHWTSYWAANRPGSIRLVLDFGSGYGKSGIWTFLGNPARIWQIPVWHQLSPAILSLPVDHLACDRYVRKAVASCIV